MVRFGIIDGEIFAADSPLLVTQAISLRVLLNTNQNLSAKELEENVRDHDSSSTLLAKCFVLGKEVKPDKGVNIAKAFLFLHWAEQINQDRESVPGNTRLTLVDQLRSATDMLHNPVTVVKQVIELRDSIVATQPESHTATHLNWLLHCIAPRLGSIYEPSEISNLSSDHEIQQILEMRGMISPIPIEILTRKADGNAQLLFVLLGVLNQFEKSRYVKNPGEILLQHYKQGPRQLTQEEALQLAWNLCILQLTSTPASRQTIFDAMESEIDERETKELLAKIPSSIVIKLLSLRDFYLHYLEKPEETQTAFNWLLDQIAPDLAMLQPVDPRDDDAYYIHITTIDSLLDKSPTK